METGSMKGYTMVCKAELKRKPKPPIRFVSHRIVGIGIRTWNGQTEERAWNTSKVPRIRNSLRTWDVTLGHVRIP